MTRWDSLRLTAKVAVSARRGAILCDPVVGADSIYIGDYETETVKLRRADLQELWRVPSERRSPAVLCADEGILIMASGVTVDSAALKTATGERLWVETGGFAGMGRGRPLLRQRRHYLQSGPSQLYVMDAMTGAHETLDIPIAGITAICGDVLLFLTEKSVDPISAYSLEGRRLLWERNLRDEILAAYDVKMPDPLPSFVCGSPGRFVVACGRSTLGCSLESGRVLWHAPVWVTYYSPNVYEGRVYVAHMDRSIAIDEATGEVLYDVSHPELRGAVLWRPGTVYGETIAYANEQGLVAIFDRRDGSLVEIHKYKAPLWGTAEADGRLLVSTGDGKLLVFEEKPAGSKRDRTDGRRSMEP